MRHKSQNFLRGIFVRIPQHQKGSLIYIPSTRKIVSSYEFVFDETFSSALAYTSHPYSEALAMQASVSYIPYATSSHEQTGNIITFEKFEDGGLVENGRNAAEYISDSASIDDSHTEYDYDDGSISTDNTEDIWGGSQIHPELNARDTILEIRYCIKQLKD